jgi:hypothetical protein
MRALVLALLLCAPMAAPAAACGVKGGTPIPPLGAAIDSELPRAKLSQPDRDGVAGLRTQITELAALGKESEARRAEEQAMLMLGYRKVWLRCGPGTFSWMKLEPGEPRQ